MTWRDFDDGGGVLELDDDPFRELSLELEVIIDTEQCLSWGVWWLKGQQMLTVLPVTEA